MHHPTDRISHTTAFVTPVVEHWLEREIAQWLHPMKDRSDDPSHHERTYVCMYVCVCTYVCMYVCMSVCAVCRHAVGVRHGGKGAGRDGEVSRHVQPLQVFLQRAWCHGKTSSDNSQLTISSMLLFVVVFVCLFVPGATVRRQVITVS